MCQKHSIVAIQHFQDHRWTLNQEIKSGSKYQVLEYLESIAILMILG